MKTLLKTGDRVTLEMDPDRHCWSIDSISQNFIHVSRLVSFAAGFYCHASADVADVKKLCSDCDDVVAPGVDRCEVCADIHAMRSEVRV